MQKKLKVYYDGSCQVCAREMAHYRDRDRAGALEFIDIAAKNFDPLRHGRTLEEFMARLHVRDEQGVYASGVDAFAAIWRRLPGVQLTLLAGVIELPGVHLIASLGYELFARVRPWLPKQVAGCSDDSCRLKTPHAHF